jgi:hypothetical protein
MPSRLSKASSMVLARPACDMEGFPAARFVGARGGDVKKPVRFG